MRWLDGITDSRDMSLSKHQEMKNRDAWQVAAHATAVRSDLFEKTLMLGKIEGRRRRGC